MMRNATRLIPGPCLLRDFLYYGFHLSVSPQIFPDRHLLLRRYQRILQLQLAFLSRLERWRGRLLLPDPFLQRRMKERNMPYIMGMGMSCFPLLREESCSPKDTQCDCHATGDVMGTSSPPKALSLSQNSQEMNGRRRKEGGGGDYRKFQLVETPPIHPARQQRHVVRAGRPAVPEQGIPPVPPPNKWARRDVQRRMCNGAIMVMA